MKDIAHRDLDSSSTAGFRRRKLETSSRVIRDEGENLCGVILSSLGVARRNIHLREQRVPILLSEM